MLFINLFIYQDPKKKWQVPFKIQTFAHLTLVSLSVYPGSRAGSEDIYKAGRGAVEPPLERGA